MRLVNVKSENVVNQCKKKSPLVVTLKSDGCALNKKEREAYNLIIPDNCWGFFFAQR